MELLLHKQRLVSGSNYLCPALPNDLRPCSLRSPRFYRSFRHWRRHSRESRQTKSTSRPSPSKFGISTPSRLAFWIQSSKSMEFPPRNFYSKLLFHRKTFFLLRSTRAHNIFNTTELGRWLNILSALYTLRLKWRPSHAMEKKKYEFSKVFQLSAIR